MPKVPRPFILRVMFVLPFIFLFAGCGSAYKLYPGEISKEQVVNVRNSGEVRILAVDGQRGPNGDKFGYCDGFFGSCSLDMASGQHTFTLFLVYSTLNAVYQSNTEISLDAYLQPGHKYVIASQLDGSAFTGQFFVWDETESKQIQCNSQVFGLKQIYIPAGNTDYEMQRHMNMGKQLYFPQRH